MLIFPLINDTSRKIIHIDMDAFFASVEERDNPDLKGKPVIIGSDPRKTGGRGVVSTCNYEARKFGVHSAMSSKEAYERCPQAVFISGNYQKYRKVGMQIREIFKRYTDLVEPMSIDEAYLDVTENKLGIKSALKIAKMIQYDIWQEVHLTCSAGVSYNKFLAKLASDFEKPKGLTLILPEDAQDFLEKLPIEKFYGVGKRSVEKLHQLGVFTGADLLEIPEMTLIDLFVALAMICIVRRVAFQIRQSSLTAFANQLEVSELMVNYYMKKMMSNRKFQRMPSEWLTRFNVIIKLVGQLS